MTWLQRVFSRRRLYSDVSEEIREHLEEKVEELVAEGMSRSDAEAAARREFGNVALTEEDSRAVWRWAPIEDFIMDVRFGARMLRKNPGFTTLAVLTLALGIAANATIFTLTNCWMLRPPRITDPAGVVVILGVDPVNRAYGWDLNPISVPDFVAWRQQSQSFESMVASELNSFALTGGGEPERVIGMRVSADYFQLLGVNAALGRTFAPGEDDGAHAQVVLLSHGLWQRRFAGAPNVIGTTVRLNGESYSVAGIMPKGFRIGYDGAQLWTPLVIPPDRILPAARSDRSLRVLARLKPGASVKTANAEVATLAQRAEQIYPGSTQGWGARAMMLQRYLADEFKVGMGIQMSAVLLLLLIACANIASLQLTRATARQTEIAVRTALGASRIRLVRQFLAESLLLALAGCALGLLLAYAGVSAFRAHMNFADWANEMALEIYIDRTVLAYTLGITVIAAIVFGLVPAFQQTAVNLESRLKEGGRTGSQGRSRHRAHNALVTAQVALALALLAGAGLMSWGYLHMAYGGFGLDPSHVLRAHIRLTDGKYKDPLKQSAFFQQALERLENMPGVVSAGGATSLVLDHYLRVITFSIEGQAASPRKERAKADYFSVTPRFLATLRIPLLRGRSLTSHDNAQAPPVVLVNQAFVQRYFGKQEPLGRHLRLDTDDADRPDWSEVVGVVGNTREPSEEEWEERPQVYEPYFQKPSAAMVLVVRTASEPANFAPSLRRAVWDIDSNQPVARVQTMEQVIEDGRAAGIIATTMLASFAGLALAMATVGVFGVMAYTVAQRTHEIGVRMALGARPAHVLKMIARKGFVLGAIGIAIGLALATPLALLSTGVAPFMPAHQRAGIVVAAGALIWLVVLLAGYIPACRATKVEPTVALRCE